MPAKDPRKLPYRGIDNMTTNDTNDHSPHIRTIIPTSHPTPSIIPSSSSVIMPNSGYNSQGNHYNTPGGTNSSGGSSYHCT
eukprot:scaffold76628_cov31-Cyclotella_meneghiniana.AAC.3